MEKEPGEPDDKGGGLGTDFGVAGTDTGDEGRRMCDAGRDARSSDNGCGVGTGSVPAGCMWPLTEEASRGAVS